MTGREAYVAAGDCACCPGAGTLRGMSDRGSADRSTCDSQASASSIHRVRAAAMASGLILRMISDADFPAHMD